MFHTRGPPHLPFTHVGNPSSRRGRGRSKTTRGAGDSGGRAWDGDGTALEDEEAPRDGGLRREQWASGAGPLTLQAGRGASPCPTPCSPLASLARG